MGTISRFAKIVILLLAVSSAMGTPIKDRPIVVGEKGFVLVDEQQRIENKTAETIAGLEARVRVLEDKVAKLEGGQ